MTDPPPIVAQHLSPLTPDERAAFGDLYDACLAALVADYWSPLYPLRVDQLAHALVAELRHHALVH